MPNPKSAFWHQTNTLAKKNFAILITRHISSTLHTALFLPLILTVYLGIGQNLNQPQSKFGLGEPRHVRSLQEGLTAADSSRATVVFVNNGHSGGAIDLVIDTLSKEVAAAGRNATRVSDVSDLGYICRSSFRGNTACYGAVVFNSSPNEGDGGIWNYTLHADVILGRDFKVERDDNDAQIYTLPLQRAIDSAITRINSVNGDSSLLDTTLEWAFTGETEDERKARVRREYQTTFVNYLGVAFLLALIGVSYHVPGHLATEREKGLSQLIDAMMPTKYDWEAQAARMFASLYSFAMIYLPGWVGASIIARFMVWKETNVGIILIFFILGGFALTSQAIMGSTFFKKAQLSGSVNSLIYLLLGVLAQALQNPSTPVVAILGLLFTPCTFIFFVIYIARFEGEGQPMNLLKAPPNSASTLPGIVLWIFLILQFLFYPIIAAALERIIHGVASDSRKIYRGESSSVAPEYAVQIDGLTKIYRPSFFRRLLSFVSKPRAPTVAVNNLTLSAQRGQILVLLGANGSGKSTTMDAIAGISRFDQGSVLIDASGGVGIAPQKNVLWDELTVFEHIKIFNQLKSPRAVASITEINQLIEAIGLTSKRSAQAKTLSGGQKRKLQLGMMLTGGSAVCCIDEVSSGIDPLSRRKIWDILLSERGKRTIILTTHFLDEADLLADNIAILSKGALQAEGSAVALKNTMGAGYCIHVLNAKDVRSPPDIRGISRKIESNTIVYSAPSSSLAAEVIRALEEAQIPYRLSSPTIEDVFLQVAQEANDEPGLKPGSGTVLDSTPSEEPGREIGEKSVNDGNSSLGLLSGHPVGFFKQTAVLILKRVTLLKTNWIPYAVAFLIPIVAAAVTQLLIRNEQAVGCKPSEQSSAWRMGAYTDRFNNAVFVAGPSSRFSNPSFTDVFGPILPEPSGSNSGQGNISLQLMASFSDLQTYTENNRKSVNPGGWWIGSQDKPPTAVYQADRFSVYTAFITQNLLNTMQTNISIAATYTYFDLPVAASTGSALQLGIYFSVAVGIAAAFFGLYTNVERLSHVRGLQYSSGVRSLPLWTSHLVFDFGIFLVALVVAAIIFTLSSHIWYHPGYLFLVFLLYGLASILLSYVISLILNSQVATFAAIMAYNSVGFGIYLIAYLFILSFSPVTVSGRNVMIAHYIISIFFPNGSLFRALLIGTNAFSTACSGDELQSNPGAISAYGGPALYLAIQSIAYFSILLYHDSGNKTPSFLKSRKNARSEAEQSNADQETANDLVQVQTSGDDDGLQVKHLTKKFGKFTAVDNVTFGVRHGEVFALLGPNGAGKSTTISLIRGDIQPSRNGGAVFVEHISVTDHRALARANLGVCPQFDAMDRMTVSEHLRHYSCIRGISDVERQVQAVIRAVGLEAFTNTMAQHLSGGNKRKLSLGIALTGDPSVMLLDEPSSGLDAAAKRIMWRTLSTIAPGRSILLTTHSMEEADALANRAGIISQRMLAMGEVQELRERFGDSLYVHLVSKTAPYSTTQEMDHIRAWVLNMFPSAVVEPETFHGQMRFSVQASAVLERSQKTVTAPGEGRNNSTIGLLIIMLEENKELLGIEHHSVSPTTLNDVFLTIVNNHNVQEEGYGPRPPL